MGNVQVDDVGAHKLLTKGCVEKNLALPLGKNRTAQTAIPCQFCEAAKFCNMAHLQVRLLVQPLISMTALGPPFIT